MNPESEGTGWQGNEDLKRETLGARNGKELVVRCSLSVAGRQFLLRSRKCAQEGEMRRELNLRD